MRRAASAFLTIRTRENVLVTHAIAFNFLVCLLPFLFLVVTAARQLPSHGRAAATLSAMLQELIPFGQEAMAESLRTLQRASGRLEAFSVALIVWGSSGIFIPLEMALNRAWGGKLRQGMLRTRLPALVMTVGGSLLAFVSLALTLFARSFAREWPRLTGYGATAGALLLTYILFFLIYRFVPASRVPTSVAVRAALWGGTAWELVKYVFVAVLARRNLQAFYGPLTFAVSLVLWAYVSSLVLFFGALMVPAPRRPAAES